MSTNDVVKIPYDERTDDQKLVTNWSKATKQYGRKDWSASVTRVATSAEIAANIYIRQFLIAECNLPVSFVNALLRSANGLDGKFSRLVKPAAEHRGTWKDLKPLASKIEALHKYRNNVIHSGGLIKKSEAKAAFAYSLAIIQALSPNESVGLELP